MIKFPSIEQFRNVIRNVQHQARFAGLNESGSPIYDHSRLMPTVKFRGTVKLHGTNAGIVRNMRTGKISFQTRERELTVEDDNNGFANYMSTKIALLDDIATAVVNWTHPTWENTPAHVAIFGEWCGGNIQKGVAINGLPKMFVIFAVRLIYEDSESESVWADLDTFKHLTSPEDNIYNILNFPTYTVEIDFARPEYAQRQMVEITQAVEAECPVGKYFGTEGTGEGVVWKPEHSEFTSSKFWFKVKGEAHSVTRVKTLAPIDVEVAKTLYDFVDRTVTEQRLEQGLQNLVQEQRKPFEMNSLGDFIRWVYNDIVKEEADVIEASELNRKQLGPAISNIARKWYIEQYNTRELE